MLHFLIKVMHTGKYDPWPKFLRLSHWAKCSNNSTYSKIICIYVCTMYYTYVSFPSVLKTSIAQQLMQWYLSFDFSCTSEIREISLKNAYFFLHMVLLLLTIYNLNFRICRFPLSVVPLKHFSLRKTIMFIVLFLFWKLCFVWNLFLHKR